MSNTVYIAASLDGFIAREDGSLDWLPQAGDPDEGDYGFQDFISGIDAIVMGRKTFETVLGFGQWPYPVPVVVLSGTLDTVPDQLKGKVEIFRGEIPELLEYLGQKGWNRLYIDGGMTIQSFLELDAIDELIITTVPVLIGRGIPLFGELKRDLEFIPKDVKLFGSGLVQQHYLRKRD